MFNLVLKKLLPHLSAILIIIITSIVYFYPQFQGEEIISSDTQIFKGASQELKQYKEETGKTALWTNSMFSGMPAYQISSPQKNNIFRHIRTIMNAGITRPAGYFIFGALSFYILMLVLGVNPWLSVFAAIGFSYGTNNLILFEAGHMTKLQAIFSSPILIAGLLMIFKKKYLSGGVIFCLGMGLNLLANHYQMTFYLGLLLIILVVIELIKSIRDKDYHHILKGSVCILVALILAVGSSAAKLLPTLEYSEDTMRGSPILEKEGVALTSSQTEGLEWEYAMSWSNGELDLFSSFIPGVAGGSSSEPVSQNSAFVQTLRRMGVNTNERIGAPLYWGALPFTSGPIYFGAVLFFLFIFGAIYLKGALKWWIVLAAILTFVLSLGKNFYVFNHILFDYLPLYNKFRTPNSILSVTAILIPLLGILALNKVLSESLNANAKRSLYIATGTLGALCLFFAILGPGFFDFSSPGDIRYQQQGLSPDVLVEDRKALMQTDSFRALIYIVLTALAIWFFMRGKIKRNLLIPIVGILLLFDLWGVDKRYLNQRNFVKSSMAEQQFQARPADLAILRDEDPYYRVYDKSINTFNSSVSSYFHKTIGGNHAAKLQRYQDLIDRHISKDNGWVLNMLNTKYIIYLDQNNQPDPKHNSAALGNAWFVNSIKLVDSANEEINALEEFDPAGEVIVHREFEDYVSGLELEKTGSINLTQYAPDRLTYQAVTQGEQFAVFSEIWYGPDKGWQASIDGKPVEHIRVNYALRGMKIPAGNHQIEFVFDPQSYRMGETVSMISSIVFLVFALGILSMNTKEWKPEVPIKPAPKPDKPAIKRKVQKKRKKK